MPKLHLLWDDCALTAYPDLPWIRELLTFTEKRMEHMKTPPYTRRSVRREVPLFVEVGTEKHPALQTYQGVMEEVRDEAKARGYEVMLHDRRQEFPSPRFDLLHGFRLQQEPLLRNFLLQNRSGILAAPTRYGKTILIINTLRAFPGVRTVVTCPGKELVKQLYEDVKAACPGRDVRMLGAGSRNRYQGDDITVCSMDSLHLCEPTQTLLLLVDEPHMAVTDSRLPLLHGFTRARRYAYGATVEERYDNRGQVIRGLFGPILAERTYPEAVAEGAVAPMRVFLLKVALGAANYDKRDQAYNHLLMHSDRAASLVARICRDMLPPDWQTLLFIKDERQAEFYKGHIGEEGTIAMAKRLKPSERNELMRLMVEDKVKRCLATTIYSTGVTFNHVRAVFNLCGGGPYASTIQKPGRVAEVRPNKRCGILFDFLFEDEEKVSKGAFPVINDSENRRDIYIRKGYDVTTVESYAELQREFENYCL